MINDNTYIGLIYTTKHDGADHTHQIDRAKVLKIDKHGNMTIEYFISHDNHNREKFWYSTAVKNVTEYIKSDQIVKITHIYDN